MSRNGKDSSGREDTLDGIKSRLDSEEEKINEPEEQWYKSKTKWNPEKKSNGEKEKKKKEKSLSVFGTTLSGLIYKWGLQKQEGDPKYSWKNNGQKFTNLKNTTTQ